MSIYKLKKIIYAHKYNQLNKHFFERIQRYLGNILEKPKHKNITINI